jgi:hypothetical protein
VVIGRRDIDLSTLYHSPVYYFYGLERTDPAQNLWQQIGALRARMHDDQDRGWQVLRKPASNDLKGFDPSVGHPDDDQVMCGHGSLS